MALEQILEKISAQARSEADSLITAAEKEADDIIRVSKEEASLQKEKAIASARSELELIANKEIVAKRLNSKKELLKAERREIEKCFRDAFEELLNRDEHLYGNLVTKMMEGITQGEEAEIIFSSRERSRISDALFNGKQANVKLSFSDAIKGGFVLKTKEAVLDYSLDNLLSSMRDSFEPALAKILFKGLD